MMAVVNPTKTTEQSPTTLAFGSVRPNTLLLHLRHGSLSSKDSHWRCAWGIGSLPWGYITTHLFSVPSQDISIHSNSESNGFLSFPHSRSACSTPELIASQAPTPENHGFMTETSSPIFTTSSNAFVRMAIEEFQLIFRDISRAKQCSYMFT